MVQIIGDIFAGKFYKTRRSDYIRPNKRLSQDSFQDLFYQDAVEEAVVLFLILFVRCIFFFFKLICFVLWSFVVKEDSKTFHPLMFMKEVCGGQTAQNANMPFSIRRAKLRLLLTVERCYKIYSSCCRNVSLLRLAVASDGRC